MSVVYNVKNPSIFSVSIKRSQKGDFFMLDADCSTIITEKDASTMREGLQSLGCVLEPMSVSEGETETEAAERLSLEAEQLEDDAKKAEEAKDIAIQDAAKARDDAAILATEASKAAKIAADAEEAKKEADAEEAKKEEVTPVVVTKAKPATRKPATRKPATRTANKK